MLPVLLYSSALDRRYEVVSVLSPGRYLAQHGLLPARGWTADPASDIPAQLFPKHVQGLHASGNMVTGQTKYKV